MKTDLTITQNRDVEFYPVTFVVMRRGVVNESTVAIVSAYVVHEELQDEAKFRDTLREVMTWWMLNTAEGRRAAKGTGYDFNIGDFESFVNLGDPALWVKLLAAGISNLEVVVASSDGAGEWVFDDRLFDDELVKPI